MLYEFSQWGVSVHIDRLIEVLTENNKAIYEGIETLASIISSTFRRSNNVWLVGNGGSASTVEHFETDMSLLKYEQLRDFSKIGALTSNSSLITAAANDLSYQEIFSRILERKSRSGDLLLAVSASGNSENIINCVNYATRSNIETFALIGFDGGKLKGICKNEILIETRIGEYEIVEDIHLAVFHGVKLRLIEIFSNGNESL